MTLVPAVSHIQPGQPLYVGLWLEHKKGYHTYWKFPGIVGVPTAVDWDLPKEWKADDIQWPEPERVHMFKIRAQGYHDQVLLPVKLNPPASLSPGSSVTIKGKVSWMCCGRDCNPGFTDVSLELAVKADAATPNPRWQKQFDMALASVPKVLEGWTATAERSGTLITLTLKPHISLPTKGREVLFFTDDGLVNPDKDQDLTLLPDGTHILKMEVSQYADKPLANRLLGVLQCEQGWDARGTRSVAISVPIKVQGG